MDLLDKLPLARHTRSNTDGLDMWLVENASSKIKTQSNQDIGKPKIPAINKYGVG